jgi:ribosomal protein S18 acetylase RimI-like enzyme
VVRRGAHREAADAIAAGHADYPSFRHLFPDPQRRARALRALFGATVRDAIPFGSVLAVREGGRVQATAVWLSPDAFPWTAWRKVRATPAFVSVLAADPRAFRAFMRYGARVEQHHHGEPHWYLVVLSVRPGSQRSGHGRRLIEPVLQRADRDGVPCRLETADPNNIEYYRRVGFELDAPLEVLPGRLPLQVMHRPDDQAVAMIDALRRQPRLLPVAALMVIASLLSQLVFEFGPLWLIDAEAAAGAFGPAWAALMAALGLGGVVATRVRFDNPRTAVAVGAAVVGASVCLLTLGHPVPVTAAQVALVAITVAVGVYLSKLLHDAIDSDVRAGVASGVGTATWITFLPLAIGFGAISDRLGVHAAGWLVTALSAALACLLGYVVVKLPRYQTKSTEVAPPAHELPLAVPRGPSVVLASDAAAVDDVVEPVGVHRLLD